MLYTNQATMVVHTHQVVITGHVTSTYDNSIKKQKKSKMQSKNSRTINDSGKRTNQAQNYDVQ